MQIEKISALIQAGLPDATTHIDGDGTHFTAIVISDTFEGQSRLARHQAVNQTVSAAMLDGSLHALSLRTFTQAEWDALDYKEKWR